MYVLAPQGLLKASSVLQENYGCMHVNFGQALSVRQLCQGRINRNHYNLLPRYRNTASCYYTTPHATTQPHALLDDSTRYYATPHATRRLHVCVVRRLLNCSHGRARTPRFDSI